MLEKRKGVDKPCVTSVKILMLKKFSHKLHLPLNTSQKPSNDRNVKERSRRMTYLLTLSSFSHTDVPCSSFFSLGSFSIDDGDGSFFQTLCRLFQFAENVKCRRISLEFTSWEPHSSVETERKIRYRLFTSSIKCEIRNLNAVVVQ